MDDEVQKLTHCLESLLRKIDSAVTDDPADAACASAILAFRGDINAVRVRLKYLTLMPVLKAVVSCHAPLSLAALASRGDVDPDIRAENGFTPLMAAASCPGVGVKAFLEAFPHTDVNAMHAPAGGSGWTFMVTKSEDFQLLLDYGHQVSVNALKSYRPKLVNVMDAHTKWLSSNRRTWVFMCVAVAIGAAKIDLPSRMLTDGRLCIMSADKSHLLASEYAGMIASFL